MRFYGPVMQILYSPIRLLSVALAATAVSTAFAQVKPAVSDETIALEKFIVQSVAAPTANTLADKQQIALQPAAASVINVIKYLPGVSLSQGDAIGGDDWSTRINIRGFTEAQLGFSVDGITTGYTSYGGGAKPNRYIDIENVASVVVSQGAAEIGAASTQALGGTLAYFTDKPADQFGVLAKYTGGSFATQRAFVRVDTGKFADGTSRAFLSISSQQNDNWVRDYVGGDAALTKRIHFDAKDVTQLGNLKITAYAGIDNVNPEINFQGVSLQQFAQDPRNDRLTFSFTGKPNPDQNYAPTWTTIRTNGLFYTKFELPLGDNLNVSFQPYWAHQQGKGQFLPPYQVRRFDLAGNPSKQSNYTAPGKVGTVFFADAGGADILPVNPVTFTGPADPFNIATYTWLTSAQQAAAKPLSSARFSRYLNKRFGDNLAFDYKLGAHNKLVFGMWNEVQERERYRTWHAVIDPTLNSAYNAGAYLKSFHWKYRTTTNMFFVGDQFTLDKLTLSAGVKYFAIEFKGTQSLLQSDGSTYSKSIDSNSKALPSLGAIYRLDSVSELFTSYTRNFNALKDTIFTDNVTATGTDYSRVKPEYADNIDFGYRYAGRNVGLSATVYRIKYTDKIVNLSGTAAKDYTNTGAGSVLVNVGGLESYGVELGANYRLGDGFSLLGTFSSTNATYTANTPDGTIIKDKKVVDTPESIASYGVLYNKSGLTAGIVGKTTGKLYGTFSNDNFAKAYTVFDFNLGYTRTFSGRDFIRSIGFDFNVVNLADESYLGAVSTNDQGYVRSDPTGTTMLYNIGAPRTFVFSVSLGF